MRSIEGHGQVLGGIIELPNVMAFLGLARSSAIKLLSDIHIDDRFRKETCLLFTFSLEIHHLLMR